MKIGILETGEIHEDLHDEYGEYPSMFVRLFQNDAPDAEYVFFKVLNGVFPASVNDADAWVITGSKFGVYEDHPWIDPLKGFLRDCVDASVPVAGICFGHQILAEALGGKVEKSSKGWGVGVNEYNVNLQPKWMVGASNMFKGHAVHQDQIVDLPESASVIASSPFCQYAALAYGDADKPKAISVQPHPEFDATFMDDLIKIRLKGVIPEDIAKSASEGLGEPVNNQDWARWIIGYFNDAIEFPK